MEQSKLLELIEQARAGEPQAQEELIRAVQDRVYYHCRKMLKHDEDALDATQDVLLTMITSLDKLKEPAAFWGWVNGITANRCRHLLSRGVKEWQIPEDDEGNSMLDDVEDLDEQAVPDKALDNDETRRMVMELIDALPDEQRLCVLFYYYDEMSVKEIAQATGSAEGTVKSRLNYARKAIKEGVDKYSSQGLKLYGFSPLPFLAYFLRKAAQTEGLGLAAGEALAQSTLAAASAAAGTGAAAGSAAGAAASAAGGATTAGAATTAGTAGGAATVGASGAAGATAAAAAGAGTAAAGAGAGAAVAAGALGTKVIVGIVAGVLAVGGIAGGVVLSGQKEPEPSREARPAMEVVSPSPSGERLPFFSFGPTEEPESEPTAAPELSAGPYAALYAGKVEELRDTLGEDGIFYDLVDIDGDEIAELLVNYGGVSGRVDLYTVTPEGELCLAGEGLSSGRMGVPQYAPGRNAVLTQYNGMAGDHQELYDGYYRMGSDGTMALFYESSGSWWGEDDERNTDLTAPEELEGASWESLAGSLTAEEMLSRLGVVIAAPAPEPTPGEEPAPEETPGAEATPEPAEGAYFTEEYREDYDNGDFLEIVLNTDGSMTFHGKLTWEGEFTRYLYAGTEERGAAQEVHSGEEFARVVEVEETAKLVFLVLDNEGELEYGPDGLGQTFQNAEVSLVRFPGLTALEVAPLDFITT